MVLVRTKYEHAQRRGEGIAQGEALLASIGEQPKLRHFDVANRDRDRVTIIGSVTPAAFLTTSLTFAAGKDDYLESVFGLRDNTHQVYGAGADFAPNDGISAGTVVLVRGYNALQRSRQANPGVQFDDPSSEFQRGTVDLTYPLTRRLSVGLSYWYDQYRVSDFTLDVDANPELARGQALLMGYLYRPYRANTGWIRLRYRR